MIFQPEASKAVNSPKLEAAKGESDFLNLGCRGEQALGGKGYQTS